MKNSVVGCICGQKVTFVNYYHFEQCKVFNAANEVKKYNLFDDIIINEPEPLRSYGCNYFTGEQSIDSATMLKRMESFKASMDKSKGISK